jgi:hypothetical protein
MTLNHHHPLDIHGNKQMILMNQQIAQNQHQPRRIVRIFPMHCKIMIMYVQNVICHSLVNHHLMNIKMDSTCSLTEAFYQYFPFFSRCLEMNVLAPCGSWFRCPLCSLTYCDANLMSLHINKTHRDVLKSNQRAHSQRRSNNRNNQTLNTSRSVSSSSFEQHRLRKFS